MPQGNDDHDNEGKKQDYVVKVSFTDEQGKSWSAGTVFTGTEEAVRKLLAADKIVARPKPTPT